VVDHYVPLAATPLIMLVCSDMRLVLPPCDVSASMNARESVGSTHLLIHSSNDIAGFQNRLGNDVLRWSFETITDHAMAF
jgi:hypothetical protein